MSYSVLDYSYNFIFSVYIFLYSVYPSPRTNGDERAMGHNTNAVSKGIGLLHGVGGEHDRATLLYALDHIPHVLARHGIHT